MFAIPSSFVGSFHNPWCLLIENEHRGPLGRHFFLISRRRESWLLVTFQWEPRTFLEASSTSLLTYNWSELVQMSTSDTIINRIGGNLLSPTGVTPEWGAIVWMWIREQTEVYFIQKKKKSEAWWASNQLCLLGLYFYRCLYPGTGCSLSELWSTRTWKSLLRHH